MEIMLSMIILNKIIFSNLTAKMKNIYIKGFMNELTEST